VPDRAGPKVYSIAAHRGFADALVAGLIPRYAEMVYYGYWFAPEREAIQSFIDAAQAAVTGTARVGNDDAVIRALLGTATRQAN